MTWVCDHGACLMIPSGPQGDHLFTVALGPALLDGYGTSKQVVLVSFTSIREGVPHDCACEVAPGEHPFIVRNSYIYYRQPRIYSVADIEKRVNEGVWRTHAPCSADLFRRVISGFRKSELVPRMYGQILDSFGL